MGDHVLFFYGTLMAPQILYRVIHGSPTPQQWQKDLLNFRPAILHGYRRHRVRYADYPGIIASRDSSQTTSSSSSTSKPNNNSISMETKTGASTDSGRASVLGTVVSGLTDGDIHRLDIFEGAEYAREQVKVHILREALAGDRDADRHGDDDDGDRHLKDVLEAAKAEFVDEGEEVEAETYVWIAGREALEDMEWDFEAFKRDKMAWWVEADERDW